MNEIKNKVRQHTFQSCIIVITYARAYAITYFRSSKFMKHEKKFMNNSVVLNKISWIYYSFFPKYKNAYSIYSNSIPLKLKKKSQSMNFKKFGFATN